MKQKITMLVALVLMGALSLQAQQQDQGQPRPRRSVEERVKLIMDKLNTDLQLNATQQTSVSGTFTDYFKTNEKLMQGMEPNTRPDRSELMKNLEARDAKLKGVLSESQYKKFKDEIEPTMRRQRGPRPDGDKPGGDKSKDK